MSEKKTLYTMYQIKEAVRNLKYAALDEFAKKLKINYANHIESNPELQLAIKKYQTKCDELNALFKKYNHKDYVRELDRNRLRDILSECFEESFSDDRKKIFEQFEVISNRLSKMRKPEAALEFLKLCGIELPEKVKPIISIPVDPEFIKSILPKQKMLGEGSSNEQ